MSRIRANQITNQSADGAPTVQNGLVISGVTTSTTFSGSGANLTNLNGSNIASGTVPVARIGTGTKNTSTFYRGDGSFATVTSTTINNNADNRIITGSGTANTLEGEATLTFTNSGSAGQLNLKRSTSTDQEAIFYYGSSNLEIETREATGIKLKTNKNDRVIITSGGQIGINQSDIDADLHIATAGSSEQDGTLKIGGSENSLGLVLEYDQAGATVSKITANPTYTHGSSLLKICVDGDANADQLVLSGGGKIGINIADNTAADLQVRTGTNGAGVFRLGGSSGNGIGMDMTYSNNGATSTIFKQNYLSTNAGALMQFDSGYITFRTGTSPTERMKINSNGQVTTPSQPSFAAYRAQDSFTQSGVIVFNATRHNIGSHYNTSNGRFTAPVAGRYQFNFYSIILGSYNSAYYSIRINGTAGKGNYVHVSKNVSGWDNVCTTWILNLNASDYVDINSNSSINWHGNDWQLFSGELLS